MAKMVHHDGITTSTTTTYGVALLLYGARRARRAVDPISSLCYSAELMRP